MSEYVMEWMSQRVIGILSLAYTRLDAHANLVAWRLARGGAAPTTLLDCPLASSSHMGCHVTQQTRMNNVVDGVARAGTLCGG